MSNDDGLVAEQTILSDDGLKALGMVAYRAALLEQALADAVRECSGLTYAKTDVLVEGKTAGPLVSTSRSFVNADAPVRDTDISDSVPDPGESALTEERLGALNIANLAITCRNQMLHSAMGGALADGHVAHYTKKWQGVVVPESEIRTVADPLCAAYAAVLNVDMRALPR